MRALTILLAAIGLAIGTGVRADYRVITVDDAGVIAGQVRVTEQPPALPPQPVYKEHDTCGPSAHDDRLVVANDGGLGNVVVFLKDIQAGKAPDLNQLVLLDNVKCAFVPHVLSATVGQTLVIRNSDPILHDAHAWLGTRTLFNRAIMRGREIREPLKDPGLVHINCNVRHTWMHAYLFVADNPYRTVTGPDGRFRLDGVPPGTYTLAVWHELAGGREQPVSVAAGETTAASIALAVHAPEGPPP